MPFPFASPARSLRLLSGASLSGSYLTSSRNCRSAAFLIPLTRGKFSLFVCFFPSPFSPREMQCGRLRHRNIRGESFNSCKSGIHPIKAAFCSLSWLPCPLLSASYSEISSNPCRLKGTQKPGRFTISRAVCARE